MNRDNRPHYVISATELADWLETQTEEWWSVDGDWFLSSTVDFPCPAEELANALRRHGGQVLVFDTKAEAPHDPMPLAKERIENLADTSDTYGERTFLCRWKDGQEDWLLQEDRTVPADMKG